MAMLILINLKFPSMFLNPDSSDVILKFRGANVAVMCNGPTLAVPVSYMTHPLGRTVCLRYRYRYSFSHIVGPTNFENVEVGFELNKIVIVANHG